MDQDDGRALTVVFVVEFNGCRVFLADSNAAHNPLQMAQHVKCISMSGTGTMIGAGTGEPESLPKGVFFIPRGPPRADKLADRTSVDETFLSQNQVRTDSA